MSSTNNMLKCSFSPALCSALVHSTDIFRTVNTNSTDCLFLLLGVILTATLILVRNASIQASPQTHELEAMVAAGTQHVNQTQAMLMYSSKRNTAFTRGIHNLKQSHGRKANVQTWGKAEIIELNFSWNNFLCNTKKNVSK